MAQLNDLIVTGSSRFVNTINGNISGSSASCTGNAATATKATQDSDGNTINSTYLKLSKSSQQTIYNSGSDTPLGIKGNAATGTYIAFVNSSGTTLGYFGVRNDNKPYFYSGGNKEIITSDTIGSQSVNYATSAGSATSATKATQDGSGNTITSTYLPLSGGTLTGSVTCNSSITFGGSDSYGIFTSIDNYCCIGSSSKGFYEGYINYIVAKGSTSKPAFKINTSSNNVICMAPSTAGYGFVGTESLPFYTMYSQNLELRGTSASPGYLYFRPKGNSGRVDLSCKDSVTKSLHFQFPDTNDNVIRTLATEDYNTPVLLMSGKANNSSTTITSIDNFKYILMCAIGNVGTNCAGTTLIPVSAVTVGDTVNNAWYLYATGDYWVCVYFSAKTTAKVKVGGGLYTVTLYGIK